MVSSGFGLLKSSWNHTLARFFWRSARLGCFFIRFRFTFCTKPTSITVATLLWRASATGSRSFGILLLDLLAALFRQSFCHPVFAESFFQPFGTAVFRWLFIIHAYSGQSSDKSYIPPWKLWTFRQLNIERLGFRDPRFLSFKKNNVPLFQWHL